HYVLDLPTDKIVYDVSHQSYVHKMLTGRMDAFTDPAKYDDVTGYTNPAESPTDLFNIGHTSTSVSLAGGLATARELRGEDYRIAVVIGDGSLSGGEAFEGLDHASAIKGNFIIIVNDNQMSIAENHGGIYENLALLRQTDGQAACNLFKSMGLDYRYIAYGNDLPTLVKALEEVKDLDHPIVLHVNTQKGKGFAPAEADREHFHFSGPFERNTGASLSVNTESSYAELTASYLLKMMHDDPTVAVITAGTPGVLEFGPERRAQAGRQFIDVGIAEQEAVALASGIAKGGGKPYFGVVSSFLQRAYDQLSQDLALNNSPAVIGIYYGSILGMTDATHLGWFDIALVSNIPNMVYLAPTCAEEHMAMLDWAMNQDRYPVALRLPGGKLLSTGRKYPTDYSDLNAYMVGHRGSQVALIGAGTFYPLAEQVAQALKAEGIDATVINPRFLSGLDTPLLDELTEDHTLVVTIEDGVLDGGFGEKIARYYGPTDMKVRCYGVKKEFADRYGYSDMLEANRLTSPQIVKDILDIIK
ncbi:MAG: 1-deoxy-D-xylulose-5-phosphate synthase, partial [Paramuribaculum sp.]|nr:1-deoxy-D-xylulose-5-phosphate synthase [Paramuribaculum sp.]